VASAYVYYKGDALPAAPPPPPRAPDESRRRVSGTEPLVSQQAGKKRASMPTVPPYDKRSFHDQAAPAAGHEQSDEATLKHGRELMGRGRADEALEVLKHISPQSACASLALTLAARADADRGDLDMAAAEVQRALEIDTPNEDAILLLGVVYARQGDWPLAVQQFERARYVSPTSALVSFHLADAYRHTGRAELAAREYRTTIRKLDGHPPDTLLDGVAVVWLRETCQRQLESLPQLT